MINLLRSFLVLCLNDGLNIQNCSIERVAAKVIKLFQVSKNQARNAYSALLLVPGFDQLRFCTLLNSYKKIVE